MGEEAKIPWQQWLQHLTEVSAETPDWDSAEDFTTNVTRIVSEKRSQRFDARLEHFKQEAPELTAFFELPPIADWRVEDFAEDAKLLVFSLLQQLDLALVNWRGFPKDPTTDTYSGWQKFLAERQVFHDQVLTVYNQIAQLRRPASGGTEVVTSAPIEPASIRPEQYRNGAQSPETEEPRVPQATLTPEQSVEVSTLDASLDADVQVDKIAEFFDLTEPVLPAAEANKTRAVAETASVRIPNPEVKEEAKTASSRESTDLVFWKLMKAGRLGLAYHLARAVERLEGDPTNLPPSTLVKIAALGSWLATPYGDLARQITDDFKELADEAHGADRWPEDQTLMGVAAALRPALLITVSSGAGVFLRRLLRGLSLRALREYCEKVAEFSERGQPLAPLSLKAVKDNAAAQLEVADLQNRTKDWRARAKGYTFLFEPATEVWRNWLLSGHCVAHLLDPVEHNDFKKMEAVRKLVAQFSDVHEIDRLVDSTAHKELGQRTGNQIEARALRQLRAKFKEALKLATDWLEISNQVPRSDARAQFETSVSAALARLESAISRELTDLDRLPNVQAAVACLHRAIEDVAKLFDPAQPFSVAEPPAEHILSVELLREPSVLLDSQWMPNLEDPILVIDAICRLANRIEAPDWRSIFELNVKSGNHDATERVIDYLRRNPHAKIEPDLLAEQRRQNIEQWKERLRLQVDATKRTIEGGVALSLLGERARTAFAAQVEAVEAAIETTTDFQKALGRLTSIEKDLAEASRKDSESARLRLDRELIQKRDSPEYRRIREIVDRGDFLTANEYLDVLARGDHLPEPSDDEPRFLRIFPKRFEQIEGEFRSGAKETDLIRKVRDRRELFGANLQAVMSADQAESAAKALESWFAIKRRKGASLPEREQIRDLLTFLGFNASVSGADRTGRTPFFPISSDIPKCPIPAYGSAARGKYRLICFFDRKNEVDVVEDLGALPQDMPFIVLYFSRLDTVARRNLAQLCRAEHRTILLVDDLLFLFLCCEMPSRLQALFQLALPFTYSRPYTSKPGYVYPEMFFGRTHERNSILDPSGACFIYGGRQLGKSALLRQVRDGFHNPANGHLAILLDLENSVRIGIDRPMEDLWLVLQREFGNAGIDFGKEINVGPDRLFSHLNTYLQQDSSRRILLLLDEADRFLDIDSKQKFAYLRRLKEFTEKVGIDRRFKVVFAGLHNVQRTTRDMNNPLAHLQDAICIGPLLEAGEWREALQLIERPFATLGYFFETKDLLMPILSKTNYYPSLIQLFCMRLLAYLDDPKSRRFDVRQTPPYIIRKEHVDRICTELELRNQIKYRFDLTLDLDPRYRIIAHTVALETITTQPDAMIEGLDWQEIRRWFLQWTGSNFADSTTDDGFRVLLDEMVGLGILRVNDNCRYALRSPNVLSFMGNQDDIENGLLNVKHHSELAYEAADFRAALPADAHTGSKSHLRSPLTAEQTSSLVERKNAVSVLFGSAALGIDQVPTFLELAFDPRFVFHCSARDDAEFRTYLDELRHRNMENLCLGLIPSGCPWSVGWVESAVNRVGRLTSERAKVRLLFLADPAKTFAWAGLAPGRVNDLYRLGLTSMELRLWRNAAVEQWLRDCEFPHGEEDVQRLAAVSGNWPLLIEQLFEIARTEPRMEKSFELLAENVHNSKAAKALLTAIGFDDVSASRQVLSLIGTKSATAEEVRDVLDDPAQYPLKSIERVLCWAEKLQIVRPSSSPTGIQTWQVDAVVASLLTSLDITHA